MNTKVLNVGCIEIPIKIRNVVIKGKNKRIVCCDVKNLTSNEIFKVLKKFREGEIYIS